MYQWLLGQVVEGVRDAVAASGTFDPEKDVVRFDPFKANDLTLKAHNSSRLLRLARRALTLPLRSQLWCPQNLFESSTLHSRTCACVC